MGIKVAGFGGQGVLLLGQLLAEMGAREGLEVSWLPSYGPEMRSGGAHCHVWLANQRIGSPLVPTPEVLIAMNEFSLRKFLPQVANGGLVLYNGSSLPEDLVFPEAQILCVPASEIADSIGSPKTANIVMLGALLEKCDCLLVQTAFSVLRDRVKNQEFLQIDQRALSAGRQFIARALNVGPVTQPDGFA